MAEELIDDGRRDKLTRDELNALALEKGVTNPEQFGTKAEVAAAINERITAANAREGQGGGDQASAPRSTADAQGQAVRGGAQASDVDDAAGRRQRADVLRRERGGDDEEDDSAAARLRRDREDDRALMAGDALDKGRPPTARELEAAGAQASKEAAQLLQEQADAVLRQGQAGVGAEFQPPPDQKPVFVARGQHVNPDGRRATRRNLMLTDYDEDDD